MPRKLSRKRSRSKRYSRNAAPNDFYRAYPANVNYDMFDSRVLQPYNPIAYLTLRVNIKGKDINRRNKYNK